MPLVSIIIPAYNYGKFLFFTLESLKNQLFRDWECLIVDDGSTDDTRSVAEAFTRADSRYRYIYQANKGVSAARNNGIAHSQGAYIQFLDADDLIEKAKLQTQVQAFINTPTLDIVYSSARYFRDAHPEERLYFMTEQDPPWIPEFSGEGRQLLPTLIKTNMMPMHCPLIKKEAILRVGYFNESMKYLEDWEFWFRCAVSNLRFFYSDFPDTFALVRVHGASVSNKKWEFRWAEYEMKNKYFISYIGPALREDLDRDIKQLKKVLVGLAIVDLVKGKPGAFRDKIRRITGAESLAAGLMKVSGGGLWPFFSWKMLVKGLKALGK
jgi:glycosyltransferase involved in cell wall biosynthesis